MLFNTLAARHDLPWTADSRGLALERGVDNHGPFARCVEERMQRDGHALPASRMPQQVSVEDLTKAHRVIALKEAEHRPLLSDRYPGWEERVEYWHVHDIDFALPEVALAEIEQRIADLVESLRREPG